MLIRILIAVGLVLLLGEPGLAARSDLEKDLKRYEKIVKKKICICRAAGEEGEVGYLTFFKSDDHVKVTCRLTQYDVDGDKTGSGLCNNNDYDIVGP